MQLDRKPLRSEQRRPAQYEEVAPGIWRPARSTRRANHARRKRQLPVLRLRKIFFILGGVLLLLLGTTSVSPLLWSIQHGQTETSGAVPHPDVAGIVEQPTLTPQPATTMPQQEPASPDPAAVPADAPAPMVMASPTHIPTTDHEIAAAIDTYMSQRTTEGGFSGAILVARDGKVLISKGYGMADHEQGIVNTAQTRFRLASLTKSFTAMAVLILQEQGKLNIYDPICMYLDDCPEAWQPLTIRHLLTHTSGLPNYTDFIDYEDTEMHATTPDELIARFRDKPLLFEPGSSYSYCNSGYVLLGVIIERASGQPYEDFLRTNIFEPLEMHNSGYDHNVGTIQAQAAGYRTTSTRAPFLDTSTLHAAGSLYSTVEDMYRWDQALYSEQLLSKSLLDEMFTPVLYNYGYGWRIETLYGRRVINHTGFITGFSNYVARYPEERVFIVVLSNLEISWSQAIGEHLARVVFGIS